MEWVTTTGRSLAEAKERALDQLGVAEDDAEFEIIDEPRPGLFGRVRGEAKVRARVRPTQARPKADRRDRRKPKRADGAGDGDASGTTEDAEPTTAPTAARATGSRGGRSGRSGSRTPGAAGAAESTPAAMSAAAAAEALLADLDADAGSDTDEAADQASDADQGAAGGTAARRRRRGGRGRGTRGTGPDGERAAGDDGGDDANGDDNDEFDSPRARTGSTQQEEPVDAQQVGDEARTFVQGLVDAFGLEGATSVRVEGDDLEVSVDGSDLGLLVGPRGTTLQAVQELTRVAAQRRHGDHDTRLRVDVGGYRVRRREALTRFALDQAAQVVAEGAARALEPMSSSDRKVIHDALAEFDGVATRSEGDDPARRVVIAPAND